MVLNISIRLEQGNQIMYGLNLAILEQGNQIMYGLNLYIYGTR